MGTVGQTRDRGPTLGDDEDADDSNRSGQSRGELGVVVIWWSLVLFPSSGSLVIGGLVVCCLVVDDEFRRLDSTNDEMMRMIFAQPEESHRRQEFVPVVPVQFLGDRPFTALPPPFRGANTVRGSGAVVAVCCAGCCLGG